MVVLGELKFLKSEVPLYGFRGKVRRGTSPIRNSPHKEQPPLRAAIGP